MHSVLPMPTTKYSNIKESSWQKILSCQSQHQSKLTHNVYPLPTAPPSPTVKTKRRIPDKHTVLLIPKTKAAYTQWGIPDKQTVLLMPTSKQSDTKGEVQANTLVSNVNNKRISHKGRFPGKHIILLMLTTNETNTSGGSLQLKN